MNYSRCPEAGTMLAPARPMLALLTCCGLCALLLWWLNADADPGARATGPRPGELAPAQLAQLDTLEASEPTQLESHAL